MQHDESDDDGDGRGNGAFGRGSRRGIGTDATAADDAGDTSLPSLEMRALNMEEMNRLAKENFDLKLRLYKLTTQWESLPENLLTAANEIASLKTQLQETNAELQKRTQLLQQALETIRFLRAVQERAEAQQLQQQQQQQQQQPQAGASVLPTPLDQSFANLGPNDQGELSWPDLHYGDDGANGGQILTTLPPELLQSDATATPSTELMSTSSMTSGAATTGGATSSDLAALSQQPFPMKFQPAPSLTRPSTAAPAVPPTSNGAQGGAAATSNPNANSGLPAPSQPQRWRQLKKSSPTASELSTSSDDDRDHGRLRRSRREGKKPATNGVPATPHSDRKGTQESERRRQNADDYDGRDDLPHDDFDNNDLERLHSDTDRRNYRTEERKRRQDTDQRRQRPPANDVDVRPSRPRPRDDDGGLRRSRVPAAAPPDERFDPHARTDERPHAHTNGSYDYGGTYTRARADDDIRRDRARDPPPDRDFYRTPSRAQEPMPDRLRDPLLDRDYYRTPSRAQEPPPLPSSYRSPDSYRYADTRPYSSGSTPSRYYDDYPRDDLLSSLPSYRALRPAPAPSLSASPASSQLTPLSSRYRQSPENLLNRIVRLEVESAELRGQLTHHIAERGLSSL